MSTPAIGIVIPACNAGSFLIEAIDSVRFQTFINWECIIVDDGSTDETPIRLKSYRDFRIRAVRQDNCGARVARSHGFSLTRSPKIVFLDADDRLLPDALSRYAGFLDEHPSVGVVYGERMLISEEGKRFGWRGGALLNKHPKGDVLESILRRPFLSTPSQACLRREAVPTTTELRGPSQLGGDWLLLARSALENRFAYLGKSPLVEYRIRRGSTLRSVANDPQCGVGIHEYEPVLNSLFSLPGLGTRFSAANSPNCGGWPPRAAWRSKDRSFSVSRTIVRRGAIFMRHFEPDRAIFVIYSACLRPFLLISCVGQDLFMVMLVGAVRRDTAEEGRQLTITKNGAVARFGCDVNASFAPQG